MADTLQEAANGNMLHCSRTFGMINAAQEIRAEKVND